MALFGFELDEIVKLVQLFEESGLDEFIINEDSRYLRIRGPRSTVKLKATAEQSYRHAVVTEPPRRLPPPSSASPDPPVAAGIHLTSPMMGMFYRSDKPGAAPLVTVGQHVSVGQVIGIIEAMKIFSEVLAEHAGVVIAVPAGDGQLVHAGATLVILQSE